MINRPIRSLIILASVTLLILGLAGCGGGKAAREAAVQEAAAREAAVQEAAVREARVTDLENLYEAVVAVEVSIQLGVNYISYKPLVAKAATAFAVYESEDDEAGQVESLLKEALDNYTSAVRAWSIKFEFNPSEWQDFARVHPGMTATLDIHDPLEWYNWDIEIAKAIQYFWSLATWSMEAAREKLAIYKDW